MRRARPPPQPVRPRSDRLGPRRARVRSQALDLRYRRAGGVAAPEAVEHAARGFGREAAPGVLDRDGDMASSGARRTATAPSEGVCCSAFVSRLSSTRSTWSGAQRTTGVSPRRWSSVTPRARASASTPRMQECTRGATAATCSHARARRRRSGRARRGRRQVCRVGARAPAEAQVLLGCASPSSIASSMALIDATGVRRSWLAAATSSRRASKRLRV